MREFIPTLTGAHDGVGGEQVHVILSYFVCAFTRNAAMLRKLNQ